MQYSKTVNMDSSISRKMYNEIIERVKNISKEVLNNEEIKAWIIGGNPNLYMCFVGDDCPKKYRDDVMNIIKDVESHYSI